MMAGLFLALIRQDPACREAHLFLLGFRQAAMAGGDARRLVDGSEAPPLPLVGGGRAFATLPMWGGITLQLQ